MIQTADYVNVDGEILQSYINVSTIFSARSSFAIPERRMSAAQWQLSMYCAGLDDYEDSGADDLVCPKGNGVG